MELLTKHIKRHYDIHIGIKKQLFIEKSKKINIFRYFDTSKSQISKYQYLKIPVFIDISQQPITNVSGLCCSGA